MITNWFLSDYVPQTTCAGRKEENNINNALNHSQIAHIFFELLRNIWISVVNNETPWGRGGITQMQVTSSAILSASIHNWRMNNTAHD
jgi:hypothetical protein